MNLKNLVQAIGFGQSRANRLKSKKTSTRRLVFNPLDYELEKRQLLATFSYSSGLLTIQTDSTNEQLSIISTSESGNYTITTSGTWSGSPVSGLSNTSTNLYVNQPAGLASILVNDNGGTVSNSSFGFGTSSANFVNNLTVNFTNSLSSISGGNSTSFTTGKALSLTSNAIALSSNITTIGTQTFTGNVTISGNVSLLSGGSAISFNGTINRLAPTPGNLTIASYTSNATWTVPAGIAGGGWRRWGRKCL